MVWWCVCVDDENDCFQALISNCWKISKQHTSNSKARCVVLINVGEIPQKFALVRIPHILQNKHQSVQWVAHWTHHPDVILDIWAQYLHSHLALASINESTAQKTVSKLISLTQSIETINFHRWADTRLYLLTILFSVCQKIFAQVVPLRCTLTIRKLSCSIEWKQTISYK